MGDFNVGCNVGCVEDAFGRGQEVLDAWGFIPFLRRAVAEDLLGSLMSAASKCLARISLVVTSRELTFSGLIGVRDSSIGNTGGNTGWFSSGVAGKLSFPFVRWGLECP